MFARSYLFVPGTRPDRFEKALSSGAHAAILDLEDAVSVAEKDEARAAISAWLSPEHPAYVRINAASTEWFRDDLDAIARPGLSGILLPKAEEPSQISEAASLLTDEAKIVPILETGLGIWNALSLSPPVAASNGSPSGRWTSRWMWASTVKARSYSTPARVWCSPHASQASCRRSTG